jgi:hypothetical protein
MRQLSYGTMLVESSPHIISPSLPSYNKFIFLLLSGADILKNQTALSFSFSVSPIVTNNVGSIFPWSLRSSCCCNS